MEETCKLNCFYSIIVCSSVCLHSNSIPRMQTIQGGIASICSLLFFYFSLKYLALNARISSQPFATVTGNVVPNHYHWLCLLLLNYKELSPFFTTCITIHSSGVIHVCFIERLPLDGIEEGNLSGKATRASKLWFEVIQSYNVTEL